MNITSLFLFKRSNGYWYVIFKEGGRTRWKATKARRKRDALLFLTDFKEAIKAKARRMFFSEFIKEYEEIEGPSLRESTLDSIYRRAFKNFISLCGDRDLSQYTPRDVDLFKAKRGKDCSPTTVNMEFRALKAAFNCGVRWEFIEENPFAKCSPMRIPEKPPNYLSKDQFNALYEAVTEPLFKRVFLFAVLTGMRLSEILNLEWSGIDFEKKLILVSNSEVFLTKTGKMRVVPMSDRVLELLREIRSKNEESRFVFEFKSYKLSKSYVDHKFREYRISAGLAEGVSFHSLRHTFATWLVQSGASIYEVQKLLGHSDIKVTQIYSHLLASELHNAVNKINIQS
jgi:site-specific recombinase XerD